MRRVLLSIVLAVAAVAQGQNPVFDAIARGDEAAVTAALDRGLPLTTANPHGHTLLHWAVVTRQARIASLLLSRGAQVDVAGPSGRTPLHEAASGGDQAIVRLLLDSGATAYPADRQGQTPLDVAVEQGHRALFPMLTPLHAAAERGDSALARRVVQREPTSVSARDESGASALHLAAAGGHMETVSLLAEAGADVNARGACGETPLHEALARGREETAAFLRSKGATDQSDAVLLHQPLRAGEAVIWYLVGAGWAIRTSSHVVVFDHVPGEDATPPPYPRRCLAGGQIDPAQLRDQHVIVFASFVRNAAHRQAMLSWRTTIPRITYVFGDGPTADGTAVHVPPRTSRRVGDLQVLTMPTTGYGEGFIVTVDGLTLFYGGDHQSSEPLWPAFTREIDFLEQRAPKIDIAFLQMMFEEQMSSSRGVLYALKALRPAWMLPNSAVASRAFFAPFVRSVAEAGLPTVVQSARRRGDVFVFPGR